MKEKTKNKAYIIRHLEKIQIEDSDSDLDNEILHAEYIGTQLEEVNEMVETETVKTEGFQENDK